MGYLRRYEVIYVGGKGELHQREKKERKKTTFENYMNSGKVAVVASA